METHVDENGTQFWYKDGKRHREDGPAVMYPDGTQYWYMNGKRHREGEPAIIYADGRQFWYKNGVRHREDGPAFSFGEYEMWYENGIFMKSNAMEFDVEHYLTNKVPILFLYNVNYEVFNMNVDLFTCRKLPSKTIYRKCIINFDVYDDGNFIDCILP